MEWSSQSPDRIFRQLSWHGMTEECSTALIYHQVKHGLRRIFEECMAETTKYILSQTFKHNAKVNGGFFYESKIYMKTS